MEKEKKRNYQPMKPDPTKDPGNDVVMDREQSVPRSRPASENEIGSSIVRRDEADDED